MSLAQNGRALQTFSGVVEGRLILEERGTGGFGYDTLFMPDGFEQTFGELRAGTKNGLSHRARENWPVGRLGQVPADCRARASQRGL